MDVFLKPGMFDDLGPGGRSGDLIRVNHNEGGRVLKAYS